MLNINAEHILGAYGVPVTCSLPASCSTPLTLHSASGHTGPLPWCFCTRRSLCLGCSAPSPSPSLSLHFSSDLREAIADYLVLTSPHRPLLTKHPVICFLHSTSIYSKVSCSLLVCWFPFPVRSRRDSCRRHRPCPSFPRHSPFLCTFPGCSIYKQLWPLLEGFLWPQEYTGPARGRELTPAPCPLLRWPSNSDWWELVYCTPDPSPANGKTWKHVLSWLPEFPSKLGPQVPIIITYRYCVLDRLSFFSCLTSPFFCQCFLSSPPR